jgi:RHH-type proline utilization regulon transcriptional repressor/proline dehydrogenase/delta 1-pyrroline-5-carboxylate dehydrogenase
VIERVEFEMLQGMAPAQSEVVRDDTGSMLLYTPVVARTDFDVAIGYLFRRLEENASSDNFLRHLFSLQPGSVEFTEQEQVFRRSLALRHTVGAQPRRTQDRTVAPTPVPDTAPFDNEADTDPVLEANRRWADQARSATPGPLVTPLTTDPAAVDAVVATAVRGAASWSALPASERRTRLRAAAEALAARRGELLTAMIHEGSKTVEQADPEISEAIDFARWYADRALDLDDGDGTTFTPLGVMLVVPPWNFPVAIPAGGVLAALAAGNAVVAKPAPETPRCFELVVEALWEAGIPNDALQFIRTPDDDVGRHLVTHPDIDGVILTGGWETANLFRSWKPELRLFAETSGKNALIVTPQADLDLAAADLVRSAFGHSGQKCSAASLGILVGDVATSPRFRRQLLDAARSLTTGPTSDPGTVMGPVIREPEGALERALTGDPTETGSGWLLEPKPLDDSGRLWSPGILADVEPGSWFHLTECFGPVLGLLTATDLDHAIELQNEVAYGLTGGIHTLDPREVERWMERVEVGNAYINRHITGAIVRRQPFGGWKRSVIGPGAKAGGPNYVTQLGTWTDDGTGPRHGQAPGHHIRDLLDRVGTELSPADRAWVDAAVASDAYWWDREFADERDESGLRVEANVFRYRPRAGTVIRLSPGTSDRDGVRAILAAELVRSATAGSDGTGAAGPVQVSVDPTTGPPPWLQALAPTVQVRTEDEAAVLARMTPWSRLRLLGRPSAELLATAHKAEVDVAAEPVVGQGRRELLHHLREQAVSRTLHRFGNLIAD